MLMLQLCFLLVLQHELMVVKLTTAPSGLRAQDSKAAFLGGCVTPTWKRLNLKPALLFCSDTRSTLAFSDWFLPDFKPILIIYKVLTKELGRYLQPVSWSDEISRYANDVVAWQHIYWEAHCRMLFSKETVAFLHLRELWGASWSHFASPGCRLGLKTIMLWDWLLRCILDDFRKPCFELIFGRVVVCCLFVCFVCYLLQN